MQAFVLAAQLAVDRVRNLLMAPTPPESSSPEESPDVLYQQLLRVDAAEHARLVEPSASDVVVVDFDVEDTEVTGAASDLPPPRLNLLTDVEKVALPRFEGLSAGQIWPAVAGRVSLNDATSGPLVIPVLVQAWAPREPYEILVRDAWYLHSSPRWCFTHESDARHALLTQARKMAALGALAPRARAIAVAKGDDGWRLYIATPRLVTLHESVVAGIAGELFALRKLIAQVVVGWTLLRSIDLAATIGLDQLAIDAGGLVLLAVPEAGQPYSSCESALPAALCSILEPRLKRGSPQWTWWNEEGRALLEGAAQEMP